MLVMVLVVGCGQKTEDPATPPETEEPTTPPETEEPPAATGVVVPHAVDGMYEDCISCHGAAIEESHAGFANYETSCLGCHAAE
jgi:hypothetical protein